MWFKEKLVSLFGMNADDIIIIRNAIPYLLEPHVHTAVLWNCAASMMVPVVSIFLSLHFIPLSVNPARCFSMLRNIDEGNPKANTSIVPIRLPFARCIAIRLRYLRAHGVGAMHDRLQVSI